MRCGKNIPLSLENNIFSPDFSCNNIAWCWIPAGSDAFFGMGLLAVKSALAFRAIFIHKKDMWQCVQFLKYFLKVVRHVLFCSTPLKPIAHYFLLPFQRGSSWVVITVFAHYISCTSVLWKLPAGLQKPRPLCKLAGIVVHSQRRPFIRRAGLGGEEEHQVLALICSLPSNPAYQTLPAEPAQCWPLSNWHVWNGEKLNSVHYWWPVTSQG